jgi:alanine racemase
MTVVLSIDEAAWRDHVEMTFSAVGADALIPVVKGNGYGFGRGWLARRAVAFGASTIAVGTVHELPDTTGLGATVLVLTPSFDDDDDATTVADASTVAVAVAVATTHSDAVLTVGSVAHIQHLARRHRPPAIVVKLASSMRRHGFAPDELGAALELVNPLDLRAFAIHPPLAGDPAAHVAEIEAWLPALPSSVPVDVSHVSVDDFLALTNRHSTRTFRLRLGTALWHGDKSTLALSADVLDVRQVSAGASAGYRASTIPADGHIVLIGAGTAHGITELPDGRSPFHHARQRLTLIEPPHMHTSMAFVPLGEPLPSIGELVDVQRPLTMTIVDRTVWVR